ncbi:hypothetical protein Rsub_03873 [Raphidocelis subcapitata]|uniref:CARDB domain-containing protein n=1 Tax=Raphidocelis subcapitata TaxID=307507 RepID=A0A2V0NTL7_9CHLO|nr:hypothetical protein Rsub_03873 [Raphidocelis subcapitata]|eukprot:GBF91018.1 hypothetical protein Rsub_03873 [Raphidocelis subcapitata]
MAPRRGAAAAAVLAAAALVFAAAPLAAASDNPLSWYSSYFDPAVPLPGQKMAFTVWVQNISPKPTLAGQIAIFADQAAPAKCGDVGDSEFKLPPLDPLEVAAVKVSVKVPKQAGNYTIRTFVDSTCAIFSGSYLEPIFFGNEGNQRNRKYAASSDKATYVAVPRSPPSEMPKGGPYVERFVRTIETEPALPQLGQDFVALVKARGVANWGTAPLEPGTRIAVWADIGGGLPSPSCGAKGDASTTLDKKLAPGKEMTVPVTLKAPLSAPEPIGMAVFVDADCKEDSDVDRSGRVAIFSYSASQGPIPHFATVYKSADQCTGKVKVKPGKPSAAKEIKFSAKLTNSGAVDSVAGLVVGWAKAIDATTTYGYVEGDYCAFSGTTVSVTAAPGDSPVIKAGKSKTVSVTVPAGALAPGTYVMSLVASSSNCSVNIGQPIYPSYTSFVVGA